MDIRRYEELGSFKNSWLNAHYHFSFSNYYDPAHTGIGKLLVINDDIVRAGGGFDMHPHRDMEIITFVRSGAISHRDSLGNEGRTEAGDIQVMSAGRGIVHAEHNLENVDTNLYQIWIEPHTNGVQPRWETRKFRGQAGKDLPLLVSGFPDDEGKGAIPIHQYAAIFGGRLEAGADVTIPIRGGAGYVLVSEGEAFVTGEGLYKGDGASFSDEKEVRITSAKGAEVLVIDVPLH